MNDIRFLNVQGKQVEIYGTLDESPVNDVARQFETSCILDILSQAIKDKLPKLNLSDFQGNYIIEINGFYQEKDNQRE